MKRKTLSVQSLARKRGRPLLPMDIVRYIMTFAPFPVAWAIARTSSQNLHFFIIHVWPLHQTSPLSQQLCAHPYARLTPTRLFFAMSARCELCRKGRCRNVKAPWGVFAHGECIDASLVSRFHLLDKFKSHDLVQSELTGYNPATRTHWSSTYVWKPRCMAFPDECTVDGLYSAEFGCSMADYPALVRRQADERKHAWIRDNLPSLEAMVGWSVFAERHTLWYREHVTLNEVRATLERNMIKFSTMCEQLNGFPNVPDLSKAEILEVYEQDDLYQRKVMKQRFWLELTPLLSRLTFPFRATPGRLQYWLSREDYKQWLDHNLASVKNHDLPQMTIECENRIRKQVRSTFSKDARYWFRSRVGSVEALWYQIESDSDLYSDVLEQGELTRFLNRLEARFPLSNRTRKARHELTTQTTSNSCVCGNAFPKTCSFQKCGRCCRGPCVRHKIQ